MRAFMGWQNTLDKTAIRQTLHFRQPLQGGFLRIGHRANVGLGRHIAP